MAFWHALSCSLWSLIQQCLRRGEVCSLNHRIIEYPGLERTHKDHWVQLLSPHSITHSQTMCLRVLSRYFLNSSSLGLWLLPWGACSSAQSLSGEECFPDIQLCCSLVPFPWVLSLVTRETRSAPVLFIPSPVEARGCDGASPQSPFLWTEHIRGLQLLLTHFPL